jgi:hypothetical protein
LSEAVTLEGLFAMIGSVQASTAELVRTTAAQTVVLDRLDRAFQEPGQDALTTKVRLLQSETKDLRDRLQRAEDRRWQVWLAIGMALLAMVLGWVEAHTPITITSAVPIQQVTR